ncbi:hypothetical protein TYRP_011758 [Tyrophagus putrescentiae]|nr:hypothetical protein TYRP_011758 [Tyrophagus putrescentiae]
MVEANLRSFDLKFNRNFVPPFGNFLQSSLPVVRHDFSIKSFTKAKLFAAAAVAVAVAVVAAASVETKSKKKKKHSHSPSVRVNEKKEGDQKKELGDAVIQGN